MKKYLVTYGYVGECAANECPWIETVTVPARNKREARKDVEAGLSEGIEILSIVEI
jgi:hypothetical protein|nr:MAG TPA: hypothetical protein [Caudoviricetes sp.]